MASARHQRLARLLTERPEVLMTLLERLLGLSLPGEVELLQGPEAVREGGSQDYLADGTALLRCVDGERAAAVVLEVQLGEDPLKHRRWPLYLAGVHNRLGCPVLLVVVTDSESVARWASRPIDLGFGSMVVRPRVLGPQQIPCDVGADLARECPALAVLSVVAHGRGSGAYRIGRTAIDAVRPLVEGGDDVGMLYMDVIAAFLDEVALRKISEEEMDLATLKPVSEFGKRHFALGRSEGLVQGRSEGLVQGRSEGLVGALFTVLECREIEVGESLRARVASCRDVEVLGRWLERASRAMRAAEVFGEPHES